MSVDVMTGEIVPDLSESEEVEREELETSIAKGLGSYRTVGAALAQIRDGRLYRDRFASFSTYCEVTWGLTRRHADRKILAAEVADVLEVNEVGPIGLTSESQARELAPLIDDPDALRQVYEDALADASGEPTAKNIADARKRRTVKTTTTTTTTVTTETTEDGPEPEPPAPPAPLERSAAEKKVAERAHDAAVNLSRFDPCQLDERTIRLLETVCKRWRNQ